MNDVIGSGRAAWDRLKKGSGLWADWVFVGHALLDGRKMRCTTRAYNARTAAGIPTPLAAG